MDWAKYIPEDGKFWVKKAGSIKSKLFSPSDIQRIVKKAIVEKLKTEYHTNWFQEDGAEYPIRVFFYKDEAIIALDSTGESLHKRGYRKMCISDRIRRENAGMSSESEVRILKAEYLRFPG